MTTLHDLEHKTITRARTFLGVLELQLSDGTKYIIQGAKMTIEKGKK